MVVNLEAIGGWRWCYWLHAIVSGVSLLLFILCYFPPGLEQLTRQSRLDQLKSIDYGGFALYAGGLVCLLLGLCMSLNEHSREDTTDVP